MISLALLLSSTGAWLAGSDERSNVVKAAGLTGTVEADGANYKVTNGSNQPAVVRVMLTPVVTKNDTLLSDEAITYSLAANWTDGGDGWIYYTGVVAAGSNAAIFATPPAVTSDLNASFSEAGIRIDFQTEFIAATKWTISSVTSYAYRDAWFGGAAPSGGALLTIDTQLATAISGSY
jgi:hypothetical protein